MNQGGLNYDPLNVGNNNMAANNNAMNSSNIKRAVSDNVQFYTQGHFVKTNSSNIQGEGYHIQGNMA